MTRQQIVDRAYEQYQQLESLAHLRAGSPFVGGDGPLESPLLIVGEAPGPQEIKVLRPFIGPAGQQMDEQLASAGIKRPLCRVTNAVKYMPLETDGCSFRTPYYPEIAASLTCLLVEVAATRPVHILAMGATALKALAPRHVLSEVHGRIIDVHLGVDVFPLLPLYHPSYCLRNEESKMANRAALQQLGMNRGRTGT